VGDTEGLRADTEASVAAQRLAELTQGQKATLRDFLWGKLSTGELGRVTQSLHSNTKKWRSLEQLLLSS